MKKNLYFLMICCFLSMMTAGCNDDDSAITPGELPVITLDTENIISETGSEFSILGTLTDKEGLSSVTLKCPPLLLNQTIDLVKLYGSPQKEYRLDFPYSTRADEMDTDFTIVVIANDMEGQSVSAEVKLHLNIVDIIKPTIEFTSDVESTIDADVQYTFGFSVKDEIAIDYIEINIPGIMEDKRIDVGGKANYGFSEIISFPNETKDYYVTVTAVDMSGNSITENCTLKVKEIYVEDYQKMYLADVKTKEELTSDVFGVPMVINHIGQYKYRARYYNKSVGTEIFFIPQKTDFAPNCFGLDPNNSNVLINDPETAKPIVLNEAGVYYEIDIDIKKATYQMRTYSVSEATNPMNYKIGEKTYDRWENGNPNDYIEFFIGWGGSPQDACNHKFIQDANNPHLFYYPAEGSTWPLENGTEMNFIVSNCHPDGWWDNVEWRADNSTEIEKFGYYSKKNNVNPNWEGTNLKWSNGTPVEDNWFKPIIQTLGNYRFEFDAHLGRGKIVPVN